MPEEIWSCQVSLTATFISTVCPAEKGDLLTGPLPAAFVLCEGRVTSAVGMLGTDGTCRALEELLMKARGLEEEGFPWILTGSYGLPSRLSPAMSGETSASSTRSSAPKLAISDHRSSHPSIEEIRRAVSDVRVGGILSGKAGCLCVHMGSEARVWPRSWRPSKERIFPAQFAPTQAHGASPS